ncbi:MAG: Fe-S cluster assembly ATPase SufC [Thermogladius sp.]|jgi:Fe-S cluster assembly ATP-binding protein|nr:Fe-S cluster assembly ATPase SufC [Thermogladius sp.]
MLEVDNVSVEVNGVTVVRGVSFRIKRGEIVVLMGPNGSGKTSLAYAIMGHPFYKVVEGRVLLEGEDVTKLPPNEKARRGLFLFFQNPVEVRGVSLLDLAKAVFEARGLPGSGVEKLVLETAEKVGLKKTLLTRGLNEGFSGGEKKRSELLQAMLLKPRCLIMDEPDSGLDVEGVRLLADFIRERAGEGACFLLITHYPNLLNYVTPSKVLVLAKGVVKAEGGIELVEKISREGYNGLV